jgi:hypothetical protein
VTLRTWFEGQKEERSFVCTVSRVLSGHCSVRSHLGKFRRSDVCVCAGNYETVDHFIWHCERFRLEMYSLGPEMVLVSGPIRFYFLVKKK